MLVEFELTWKVALDDSFQVYFVLISGKVDFNRNEALLRPSVDGLRRARGGD